MCICTAFGGVIMNKICTFAGHADGPYGKYMYKKMISCIEQLICEKNISEFWVGGYGSFDTLSILTVSELKKRYPHIRLCNVIPYMTSFVIRHKAEYEEMFDEIIIPDICEKTPKCAYIPLCNQYMVDKSDVLICFVKVERGGAFNTFRYAQKKSKEIINLAD